jgi:hypothetical protein
MPIDRNHVNKENLHSSFYLSQLYKESIYEYLLVFVKSDSIQWVNS